MRRAAELLQLSATDLANHLACRHVTTLDRAAAWGRIQPPVRHRADLERLDERGLLHEREHRAHLEAQGLHVTRLGELEDAKSLLGLLLYLDGPSSAAPEAG